MINGLEGIPGSGKSYEAVAFHVLPMLQQGRKVITNLPLIVEMFAAIDPGYVELIELRTRPSKIIGTWDADRVDAQGNGNAFVLHEDEKLITAPSSEVTVFGHVWDYYSTWKHPKTGQGPVFIIDEAHVPLDSKVTDKSVVEWFKLHRHFNADVLLMTQSFRDINQSIARLLAMLVICRKADILGHADHYIRKVKAGYRGAVISTEQRKYNPAFFGLYRSHTQGNSVAESLAGDVSVYLVKFKRFTWAFWACTALFCLWAFWPAGDKKDQKQGVKAAQVGAPTVTPALATPSQLHAPGAAQGGAVKPAMLAASAPAQTEVDEPIPEPYASKSLHLVGRMAMGGKTVYMFTISDAGRTIGSIDHRDLITAGYRWEPLTDCAGTLRWGTKAKAITCDAPILAQGAQDRPVVIETGGRASGPGQSGTEARTLPMPAFPAHDPSKITQADLTPGLRLRNPLYSGPAGG